MSVKDYVDNGVELLDEVSPDWREKVNAETLDIASMDDCILGQVFGDFHSGIEAVGLTPHHVTQAQSHGFDVDEFTHSDAFRDKTEALTTEWLSRL